jgi:hypothetical protein
LLQNKELASAFLKTGAPWWFVWGLILTLASGFMTWLNWSLAAVSYMIKADPADLGPQIKPRTDGKMPLNGGLLTTAVLSVFLGFCAIYCLFGGANAAIGAANGAIRRIEINFSGH